MSNGREGGKGNKLGEGAVEKIGRNDVHWNTEQSQTKRGVKLSHFCAGSFSQGPWMPEYMICNFINIIFLKKKSLNYYTIKSFTNL